ncbi:hypothetical protein A1O3_10148 [Capronia epimyces CBS 606.96]|uniref:Uncharacterized protein n=1 Tax=Capronia epimyces CBS 606.96 TaxID=1182542 RepID=W9XJ44_9EURO|nr:uncharacterized protein A1O3_10148 [Capronia epimyces CBS 606.96]EXJ76991.1 hypothetical protein A1O3_10148 [Capronia epimyces CBS 606.96]
MAPVVAKSLSRLSREAVIDLALSWLEDRRTSKPYLLNNRRLFEVEEEDYLHVPAENIEALRLIYRQFQKDGSQIRKQDVIDRIVDGDWRRGLSLHQHASIDFAYLEQNDAALRWSALRLVPLAREEHTLQGEDESYPSKKRRKLSHDGGNPGYPQVSPQTFLAALKAEISPLVKAHYHLHRMAAPYDLTIIRLYITPDTAFRPRSSSVPRRAREATDSGRVMYVALPDNCPYVYVSLSGSTGSAGRGRGARDSKGRVMAKVDMATMKKIVLEAIPKALSRPQERWALESTKLTAKSLQSVCELRGNQKPGTGGGAYSVFTIKTRASQSSPVDVQVQEEPTESDLRSPVGQRFGHMTGEHYAALDRVHVTIKNLIQRDADTCPDPLGKDTGDAGLTFAGSDVFLGLRKLAEMGTAYVDLDRMPAWMTGEMGVSSLTG